LLWSYWIQRSYVTSNFLCIKISFFPIFIIFHTKCVGISISYIPYIPNYTDLDTSGSILQLSMYFFCLNYMAGKLRLFQVDYGLPGSAVFFTTISYKAHLHKKGNINIIQFFFNVFYLKMFSFQEQFNKVFSHTWIFV
jgi:hypothetical protein